MSVAGLSCRLGIALGLVAVLAAPVAAQDGPPDRFFSDKPDNADDDDGDDGGKRKEPKETLVQGSLTSTTFAYRETGSIAPPLAAGNTGVNNASAFDRMFTDLRSQIDAKHISGGDWDARFDSRVRFTASPSRPFDTQSGAFGGKEYDAREVYLKRGGKKSDVIIGRQFVPELAAVKVDGLRIDYRATDSRTYLAFGGLYPARGSRSVLDDYPHEVDIAGVDGKRILPAIVGLGGGYRTQQYYGSIGAVAILPLADEQIAPAPKPEKTRAFLTGNGYLRYSDKIDVYHYIVLDVDGAAGSGLTNLSVGVNYRPSLNMRVTAAVNRVDTETLNVVARTKLEERDPTANAQVQNNLDVSRIASESARLGVSVGFKDNRFEVSASGQLRRRPEIVVPRNDFIDLVTTPDAVVTVPKAQAGEVTLAVLDRRSLKGFRIGGSVSGIFGVGTENLYRTDSNIVRLHGSHPFKKGLGELELDLTWIASGDDGRGDICMDGLDPLSCFGTTTISTVSVGGTAFYRFKLDWFLIGSASIGRQTITITDQVGGVPQEVEQPAILQTTGFFRVAYRF